MPQIHVRAAARRDLVDHAAYLIEAAGTAAADRFLNQAQASFAGLACEPLIGAPLALSHADLTNMRKWRIKGFDNHLIFYQPRPDGVSIVRVLHAASDWWGLLGLQT